MSVRNAALWSMGAQYLTFAVQFAVSVIVSRFFLSPEEVGLFSIALSAAMLVSILQDFGITRYIAGQPDLDERQVQVCYSVSLLFALGIGLVIVALAWPVARFYDDPRLLPVLLVVAGSYLLAPFGIVPSALLQRHMNFRGLFVVNVGAVLVWAAVVLALAAAGWSAMSLAWGTVAQQCVRAALGLWRSDQRPRFPLRFLRSAPDPQIRRRRVPALHQRIDRHALARAHHRPADRLHGRRPVQPRGRPCRSVATLVAGAIGSVFYPAFARLRDADADLAGPYARVVSGLTATVWPAMAFLAVAAEPLVLMLFGPVWAGVSPLLVWIALAEMLFVALPLTMELPILLGRMRTLLALNLLDTAASLGLLVLGAWAGLEYAAASRVGYGLVWLAIYARFIQSLANFRWRALAPIYLQSAAAALATTLPLVLIYRWIGDPAAVDFGLLAAAALAGVACWLATLFLVRHPARHEVIGFLETARAMLPRTARSG
jgi:O-antigen/teichoic acid export membrane protein